ncbi:uncharacterized protein [Parasteatoda tepidariorum]|uniref:uncharacterized protein n=1 Tax=Parasteatoda tepidariorum TaxID=114398 RepID=UPI001C725B8F|nr:uncharacterized protein LOC107451741 [Parasteatoda tepidariorum]
MLKGKNFTDEAACSLSSCRTKAETLARSANSRIWPNTWGMVVDGEAVSNGLREQEDEEFFDASPSPVEEDRCDRRDDSSAATVAGRAKLFELLQQHAVDDVTDVFYDVSENVEVTDSIGENREAVSNVNHQSNEKDAFDEACDYKTHEQFTDKGDIVFENQYENILSKSLDKLTMKDLQSTDISENVCDISDNISVNSIPEPAIFSGSINSENHILHNLNNSSFDYNCSDNILLDSCARENTSDDNLFSQEKQLSLTNGHDDDDVNKVCESNGADQNDFDSSEAHDLVNTQSPKAPHSSPIQILEESSSPVLSPVQDELTIPKPTDPLRLEVFGEFRPIISRSTSLKTGKTPPGTPGRKKIVRFADVLGLDLEDVRHIISGDLPNVPPSAYNDLVLAEEEKPDRPPSTIELKNRQQGVWETIQSATGPNVLFPTFPIPGQQPDFHDRLQTQGICLESVVISDFSVQCTCRVMNWGFSKKVRARYTVNKWMTSNDIEASYVPGSMQHNTDSFTFSIFLPPMYNSVEFALCYTVNGKEYWDNNRGTNYNLSCHGNSNTIQASTPSSPTWVHQFW